MADAEEIYNKIVKDYPNFLAAHITFIQKLDVVESKNSLPISFNESIQAMQPADLKTLETTLKRVVSLANIVIAGTNVDSLLAYYGLKSDSRTDAAKIKTEMDKQKIALLDAYVRKFIALGKLHLIAVRLNKTEVSRSEDVIPWTELDGLYAELGKFIEYHDLKV